MKRMSLAALFSMTLFGETLGFLEQKFTSINFEKNKWTRNEKAQCFLYTAKEAGAQVDVMRTGTNNLVTFRGAKGLTVTVCGSTAAFDEGFEAREKP